MKNDHIKTRIYQGEKQSPLKCHSKKPHEQLKRCKDFQGKLLQIIFSPTLLTLVNRTKYGMYRCIAYNVFPKKRTGSFVHLMASSSSRQRNWMFFYTCTIFDFSEQVIMEIAISMFSSIIWRWSHHRLHEVSNLHLTTCWYTWFTE